MGFVKAFEIARINQLTKEISKPVGMAWLLAALFFIFIFCMLLMKKESWWVYCIVAVILSQCLIISDWTDAKFGTIANIIILTACLLSFGSCRFEQAFRLDVSNSFKQSKTTSRQLVNEADIAHLPACVQTYLRYVGVLNKPMVNNFRIVFSGQMRAKGKDWFSFRSEQYNFIDQPTRLFFMKAAMYGVTVPGYHAFKNGKATMTIKPFGLVKVVDEKGSLLDKAETVTFFNDICLFAPAFLIDNRISWQPINSHATKAILTVNNQSIAATLFFNKKGQLINFESDDRYIVSDKKQYRFSTPVSNYKAFNGYLLPAYGEAVWHYPDGLFVYGKFYLKEVEYNVKSQN